MNSYEMPPSKDQYGIHHVMRLFTKRRKWIIGSILTCALLAIIVTWMTRPVYEATATIELNKSGGSMDLGIGDVLSQQLTTGDDSLLTDQQTETAILEGDSLALAVIQHLGLESQFPFAVQDNKSLELRGEKGLSLEDAPKTRTQLLGIFKSGLKVNPIRGTRLIQVTYQSHDPKQAAQIANALIESYKIQYLQSHYEATSEASDWLTKQLSDLKANVEDSEKKLTDFEKETGILSLNLMPTGPWNDPTGDGQIHSVVIQKLDTLNAELTAAEAVRIEKEAIYHLVQTNDGDVIAGLGNDPLAVQTHSMVLTQGGGLSNLEQLRQQQNQLKISLAEASIAYGNNNRHLREMQTQLHALGEQIGNEIQVIIHRAQADFQLALQNETEIHRQFEQQQAAATSLNGKTVQFAVLSQEAFSRKKLYEDLYTKLQEANVAAGIKTTNVTVVDPARSQSIPVLPRKRANVLLGTLFGLLLGLGIAFAIESFDQSVSDPQELESITGLAVIGVIPDFEGKRTGYRERLACQIQPHSKKYKEVSEKPPVPSTELMLAYPDSSAAEAFRALRNTIVHSKIGVGPNIILVTSCVPKQGNTIVTKNLAIAFAQEGRKVILIEADMRGPKGIDAEVASKVGLSNVLAGLCVSDEAIQRGKYVSTLDILQPGPRPPNPADMLGSVAFEELLKQLRLRYDIILIDSPPAFLVTDAVSISLKADAVVWVARAGAVTRPQLARACRIIERDKMPVIGFVFNRTGCRDEGYSYESYDSYYGEAYHHEI